MYIDDPADFSVTGSFTIPSGTVGGGMMEFDFTAVSIVNDIIVESDENFTLSLPDQSAVEYTVGDSSSATVVIVNDDGMYILDSVVMTTMLFQVDNILQLLL